MSEGSVCVPNFTAAGRRRRRNAALAMGVVGALLFVGLAYAHAGALARSLVGLPFAAAAVSYLQTTRNTCIAHARKGTIEHDDFSATAAPAAELAVSRRVAATILRDGMILGMVAGLVAAASVLSIGVPP